MRLLIEASAGESETEMKKLRTEVENMVVYLKSHRLHKVCINTPVLIFRIDEEIIGIGRKI